MKKILYLSNIEVPYRVRFFNGLAKHCHLTVLYESRGCQKRDPRWAGSEEKQFRACYFPKDLPKILREKYDGVIIGCYQTPLQMAANLLLRVSKVPSLLNLDGEPFLEGHGWKTKAKILLLRGARGYLVAGESAAASLQKVAGAAPVIPYYFGSLWAGEGEQNGEIGKMRSETILVVGQNYPYKGMDVALEAARLDPEHLYRFVGMGSRTASFLRKNRIPANVEVIPFLSRRELEMQYRTCGLLVLPSRRECWGLVIPEAASFGMPVVSTWGSGAAVEFLSDRYPEYLAEPGDAGDLSRCIRRFFASEDREAYQNWLLEKAKGYHMERSIRIHVEALEELL